MSGLQRGLLAVLLIELLVGGAGLWRKLRTPRPPLPPTGLFDSLTEVELRRAAEQLNPHRGTDWSRLGQLYFAHGFFPQADACFRRAVQLEPEDAAIGYRRAFLLARFGRSEEAAREFARVARLPGGDAEACWFYAGREHLRLGQSAEALAALEQAGYLPAARFERARVHYYLGQPRKALEILLPLIEQLPKVTTLRLLEIKIRWQMKSDAVARQITEALDGVAGQRLATPFDQDAQALSTLRNRSGLAGRWLELAAQMSSGEPSLVGRRVEAALAIREEPEGLDLLSEIAMQQQQWKRAIETLRKVIRRDGPNLMRVGRLGDAYRAAGNEDAARKAWTWALQFGSDAKVTPALERLAKSYERAAGADAEANRYRSRVAHSRGLKRLADGEPALAAEQFAAAVEADPEAFRSWYHLALARHRAKQSAAAREALERCRELRPEFGPAARLARRLESE